MRYIQKVTAPALIVVLPALLLVAALAWGGCGDGENGGNGASTFTPLSEFPSLGARLEVPSSAPLGEHVPLRLTVENVTEAPVQFGITGREDTNYAGGYDFVVTTASGSEVWHWLGALGAWELPLSHVKLEPGEYLRFEEIWPQADNKGKAIEPGTYFVHGVLEVEREGSQQVGLETLETEPTELVISP